MISGWAVPAGSFDMRLMPPVNGSLLLSGPMVGEEVVAQWGVIDLSGLTDFLPVVDDRGNLFLQYMVRDERFVLHAPIELWPQPLLRRA